MAASALSHGSAKVFTFPEHFAFAKVTDIFALDGGSSTSSRRTSATSNQSPASGQDPRGVSQYPHKNTFIHFDAHLFEDPAAESDSSNSSWSSAPCILQQASFHLKVRQQEPAHQRGECKPCAYFGHRSDGCRNGDNCEFCHLCPPAALKIRKKEKARAMAILKQQQRQDHPESAG